MNNAFLCVLCLFVWNNPCFCKDAPKYKASDIPEELKKNAYAVVRYQETVFEVNSIYEAVEKGKIAITILDEKADYYADFYEYYDMYSEIKTMKGYVYDQNGEMVKKFKKSEINDQSLSSSSLYQDDRMKYFEYYSNAYPYTLEYEYEIVCRGFIDFPTWYPLEDYNLSVEKSVYKTITPSNYKYRTKPSNFSENISHQKTKQVNTEKGVGKETIVELWEAKNLKALEKEPYSPRFSMIVPKLEFSPNEFFYGGYNGNLKTWQSFGQWQNQLLQGRDSIPGPTREKIIQITSALTDTLDKIKAVYEYLQEKTRYVSIQLGIGGLQPFPATTVDELGYGDCKALSNYTMALLKTIGIPSNYTIIYSGAVPIEIDHAFPNAHISNHIILTVPLRSDTLWLECTNQILPFAFVHEDIADREALMITDDGGELIRLPKYTSEQNCQKRVIHVQLDAEGNGMANIATQYSGLQYENIFGIMNMQTDEQEKKLYRILDIPSFTIKSFDYSQLKNRFPVATETLDLEINNHAAQSGKRLFVPLNLMNKKNYLPKEIEDRKTKVVIHNAYYEVDSVVYHYPQNFQVENLPEPVSYDSDFGQYKTEINTSNGKIIYVRRLKIQKGSFAPEKYASLKAFYQNIIKSDNCKAILIKK